MSEAALWRVCLSDPGELSRVHQVGVHSSSGEWSEIARANPRRDFLVPRGQRLTLQCLDMPDESPMPVVCVTAVPHCATDIVYEARVESGQLIGRLVPLCTRDRLRMPLPLGSEAFSCGGDDARLLFLARYTDASQTCTLLLHYNRTCELLRTQPWLLFLEGFIDAQGLDQALDDTPALRDHLGATIGHTHPSVTDWWVQLSQRYRELCTHLTRAGAYAARLEPVAGDVFANVLCALGVAGRTQRDDYLAPLLHARAPLQLQQLLRHLTSAGRHETVHRDSLALSMLENDVLLVNTGVTFDGRVYSPELEQLSARAWLRLHPSDDVNARRTRLSTEPDLPLMIVPNLHEWSAYELFSTLSSLLLNDTHRRTERGYERTGSAVPFKLLLCHSRHECQTPLIERLLADERLVQFRVEYHQRMWHDAPGDHRRQLVNAMIAGGNDDYWARLLPFMQRVQEDGVLMALTAENCLMINDGQYTPLLQVTDEHDTDLSHTALRAVKPWNVWEKIRSTKDRTMLVLYCEQDERPPSAVLITALQNFSMVCIHLSSEQFRALVGLQ